MVDLDNGYEMRQCMMHRQVKHNVKMRETIARTILWCYKGEPPGPVFSSET